MRKVYVVAVAIMMLSIFLVKDNTNIFTFGRSGNIVLYETSISRNVISPKFKIKLLGKNKEEVESIIIIRNNKIIEELKCYDNIGKVDEAYGLVIDDFNFDKNLDIGLQLKGGVGANTYFSYWLWDDNSQKFEYSEALSELVSTRFYSDEEIIVTENSSGPSYIEEAYKFNESKLVKLKLLKREWDYIENVFLYNFYEIENDDEKLVYSTKIAPNQVELVGYEHFFKGRVWNKSDFK